MKYKHVAVVIEALDYSQEIKAWDAINDICDYIECIELGNTDSHYENCVLDKGSTEADEAPS